MPDLHVFGGRIVEIYLNLVPFYFMRKFKKTVNYKNIITIITKKLEYFSF